MVRIYVDRRVQKKRKNEYVVEYEQVIMKSIKLVQLAFQSYIPLGYLKFNKIKEILAVSEIECNFEWKVVDLQSFAH